FARLDVAHRDLELQLARAGAVRLAAVVHETAEIPAQDPIAAAVDPGVATQLRVDGITQGLGLAVLDDLIERIERPSDRALGDVLCSENAVADVWIDELEVDSRMKHCAPRVGGCYEFRRKHAACQIVSGGCRGGSEQRRDGRDALTKKQRKNR